MRRWILCIIMVQVPGWVFAQNSQFTSIEELMGTIDEVNRANTEKIPCPQTEVSYVATPNKPLGSELQELQAVSGEKLQISVLSEAEAQALFARLKAQRGATNPCLCAQRSHIATRFLENEGVSAAKVFVKPNWEGWWGNKIWPNGKQAGNVGWNYHVAPVIFVRKADGTVEQQVLDTAIYDKPVSVQEWKSVLANSAEPYISSRYNYLPNHAWESPKGYTPSEVQAANQALETGRCGGW